MNLFQKNAFLLFFVLSFVQCKHADAQPCHEIIGYYPSWQWYDREKMVRPATIKYKKYSIINYAFFQPQPDGSLKGTDAWADQNLLEGEVDWKTKKSNPATSLVTLAHQNKVKVMISVGGWTLSEVFPALSANPITRANFAHHCRQLIEKYNIDGIDIDWEYPGYTEHGGTTHDKKNFTLLLRQIRDTLTVCGLKKNKKYLLTAALGASPQNMANVEWKSVSKILDIMNIMSYDYNGSWSKSAGHNSPLYPAHASDTILNLDASISRLIKKYKVPAHKIAAGVAFYGRSVKTDGTGLFAPTTKMPDNATFADDEGSPLFYNIVKKHKQFKNYWDADANVPFMVDVGGGTFLSYDNKKSILKKAEYIVKKGLRGAIIWEITGDYLEPPTGSSVCPTPLIDVLNEGFCKYE
jgi:chitinase